MTSKICPICKLKISEKDPDIQKYAPFCSKRCQQVDLGKWFSDSYAIPAVEPDDEYFLDMPQQDL